MAIAITLPPANVDASGQNFVHAAGTLAFSGSYVSGGDTLDFTGVADRLASSLAPVAIEVFGQSGFLYRGVPGTTLANSKVKVFGQEPTSATAGVIALTELGASAYPAGVTGDTVAFRATFRKLQ